MLIDVKSKFLGTVIDVTNAVVKNIFRLDTWVLAQVSGCVCLSSYVRIVACNA